MSGAVYVAAGTAGIWRFCAAPATDLALPLRRGQALLAAGPLSRRSGSTTRARMASSVDLPAPTVGWSPVGRRHGLPGPRGVCYSGGTCCARAWKTRLLRAAERAGHGAVVRQAVALCCRRRNQAGDASLADRLVTLLDTGAQAVKAVSRGGRGQEDNGAGDEQERNGARGRDRRGNWCGERPGTVSPHLFNLRGDRVGISKIRPGIRKRKGAADAATGRRRVGGLLAGWSWLGWWQAPGQGAGARRRTAMTSRKVPVGGGAGGAEQPAQQ